MLELTYEARAAALERRDGLLRGVAEVSRILLAGTDLSEAMSCAAAVLGTYTGSDRVVIYRFEDAGEDSGWWVEAIWEAPGVPPLLAIHGAGPLRKRERVDVCALHQAGRPWMSHTRDLPEDQREYNEAIGTLSNAKMPVHADGLYWGFVAFSDCSGERDWSEGEIHVLEGVGAVLGAAVARARREAEHREALAAERERAAQERAVELARANEALRISSEHMCSLERLDAYLSHVLASSVPLTGAVSGRVVVAGDELRVVSVYPAGLSADQWPLVPLDCAAHDRKTFTWADTLCPDLPEDWCGWHRSSGHPRVLFLPLVVRNRTHGYVELAFRRDRQPSDVQLQVLQVLARQAALAVQLTRLAQDAQHSAVTQEQERAALERAEELGAANEALSRSIARLASHDELQDFLTGLLQESLRTSGASSGGVLLYDADRDVLRTHAAVLRGEVIDLAVDPRARKLRELRTGLGESVWRVVRQEKRIHWLDYDDRDSDDWIYAAALHEAYGHRYMAAIPMLLIDKPIGFLALSFDGPRDTLPNDLKLELCRTLAQQATLAIRLSRLAEQARQAAIAQEREDLATSRAAELSEAAAALRRTGGHLAESPELTPFVHEVLHEATRHTGAGSGALFRYDPQSDTLLIAAAVDGEVIDLDSDPRFAPLRQPVAFRMKKGWQRLLEGEPVLTDLTGAEVLPSSAIAAVHRAMGHNYSLAVPILVGARIIGCLVLWFTDAPDACKVELVQALAQQTAVAIHLSELAEQSRQAAVLAERAGFARELHDTLLQGFTGVTLQIRALLRRPPEDRDRLYRMLARIERESTEAVQEARRAVGDMRVGASSSEASSEEDLVAGMALVIAQARSATDIRLDWHVLGEPKLVSRSLSQSMQRIAGEAIRNALHHAQPQTVRVQLVFDSHQLVLSIEDDGLGFDFQHVSLTRNGHFGLLGMQERAESIGGRFHITTASRKGTRIRVEVPL